MTLPRDELLKHQQSEVAAELNRLFFRALDKDVPLRDERVEIQPANESPERFIAKVHLSKRQADEIKVHAEWERSLRFAFPKATDFRFQEPSLETGVAHTLDAGQAV